MVAVKPSAATWWHRRLWLRKNAGFSESSKLDMPFVGLENTIAVLEGVGVAGRRMRHGRFVNALAGLPHLANLAATKGNEVAQTRAELFQTWRSPHQAVKPRGCLNKVPLATLA